MNRRLNRLIFILVDDIYTDIMHNAARMAVNIGRMSSETREAKKKMTAAEEINELSLEDMVQKVYIDEEVCYIVKSFTTEVVYNISTEQGIMTASVPFTAKANCHDSNKRNATAYLRYYLEIDFSLKVHTMDNIEEVTENSNVFQSEAGGRTDEVLTSITNVCKQALESRIHLTFENNNRSLQIYNEQRQLLPTNEEM
ncbi:uncharacterized protein RHIMIDRAFT_293093 [Rhizopus microsporus ATCC 52813]|uniref:Uncharacterized protein n=1 Tax=Rhizopus microsporus ATCC 52813 TaxID=1340429 RepID=A0A2G4SQ20_RHIZD|nr:uncharacterized protein RHIMIDRAFT_293093 [Rhizopus microsporus ATCC 52813]PHZ10877.1 hypothetical protein RHIMIDRAFT_293093 [Rhizopus microsporus ATCC 52813]